MKNRFGSLSITTFLCLCVAAVFLVCDFLQAKKLRTLAWEVEAYVKEPVIGGEPHFLMRLKASELVELTKDFDPTYIVFIMLFLALQSHRKGKKLENAVEER